MTDQDPACNEAVMVSGQPLVDASSDIYSPQDEDMNKDEPSGYHNEMGYSYGVYLIGMKPYALMTVEVDDSFGADHAANYGLNLYVVKDGKPQEVMEADSKDGFKVAVVNNTLTLSGVNRVHGDECMACVVAEAMSFDIDPARGRVHWHAKTAREVESVEDWLKQADPAVRAQEAQAAQQEEQQDEQAQAAAANAWYILNRDNACVSAAGVSPNGSPASMITFDLDQGLRDQVNITQRDDAGNPIAVEVGEPSSGMLETVYDFYKGLANCNSAASAAANALKGLN
jgi:hypothetical protein